MWPKRKPSSPANVRRSGRMNPLRTSACSLPRPCSCALVGRDRRPRPTRTRDRSRLHSEARRAPRRRDGRGGAARTAWTVSGTRIDSSSPSEPQDAVMLNEHAILDQHPQHLLEEERIAPVARPIASAAAGSSCPARFSSSRRASSPASGASSIVAVPAHAGRSSARSVRARQHTRIGASRLQPARYSIRSRNAGSAHCTSSSTSRTGRSRASVSSRRRTAQ